MILFSCRQTLCQCVVQCRVECVLFFCVNISQMMKFGDDTLLSRIDHMGGGFLNPTMACNVPSPSYLPSSPESLDERHVINLDPRLEIVTQPKSKFRFRYETEMKGPHGCLLGKSSKSTHSRTYPTVRLCNYYRDDAIIRCSLYTTDKSNPTPHAHTLIATSTDSPNRVEPHEKPALSQNDYVVEFPGLGILHVPQKKLISQLNEKLLMAYEEKFKRGRGLSLNSPEQTKWLEKIKTEVKQMADSYAKCMDKNQVALLFEAFRMDERGMLQPICDSVLSDPIQNQKSPKTNDLRICRIDKLAGPCSGGEEIYLLVEKISKGNIEVHFSDATGWMAKAEFAPADVHHQYAIVCRTPPYQNVDITKDVKVEIKLYRPSDQAESKPHTFCYKPIFSMGKRSRSEDSYMDTTTSETVSKKHKASPEHVFAASDHSATSLMNLLTHELCMEDFDDFEKSYTSPSTGGLSITSLSDYCEISSVTTDTDECSLESLLENFNPATVLFSSYTEQTPVNVAMDGSTSGGYVRPIETNSSHRKNTTVENVTGAKAEIPSQNEEATLDDTPVKEMTERLAGVRLQDEGKITQRCFDDTKHNADLSKCLAGAKTEIFEAAKEKVLFSLVASKSSAGLQKLLAAGIRSINVQDENGSTALHWAVRRQSFVCLKTLLKCNDIDLNVADSDGRTPLHIAVDQHDSKATDTLLDAGADVTIPNEKTGDTVLHSAVKWEDTAIIILLLQTGKFTLKEENYYEKSISTMVAHSKNKDLQLLFASFGNKLSSNEDTASDDSFSAPDSSDEGSSSEE